MRDAPDRYVMLLPLDGAGFSFAKATEDPKKKLCLYPMRFVKCRNVLAVSTCHAVGYGENGPEFLWKRGGGRRCLKRGNFCKWLIICRRALNYFSLALAAL